MSNSDANVKAVSTNEKVGGISSAPMKKKITFFAAVMLVIGGTIGAGIFFKSAAVLGNSGMNIFFALASWLIAAFAIICMGLALIEICAARNDNLSMIGWCQTFSKLYIYKGCKYFMTYVYLPLSYFFLPLYGLMSFQDALGGFGVENNNFGTDNDWVIWSAIALVISMYFLFVPGLFVKFGDNQNKAITYLKFIPIAVAAILGYVIAAYSKSNGGGVPDANLTDKMDHWNGAEFNLFHISPWFGIFGSIGAIFYAYDGFYVVAGIQSEMKQPRKTPLALFIGLGIITLIYILIAVSMSVGANGGSFYGFGDWLKGKGAGWVFGICNLCIALAVLGTLNGFSMWAVHFIQDLINAGEIPCPSKYVKRVKSDKDTLVGTMYVFTLALPICILFYIIGGLGYFPGGYAGAYDSPGHTESTAKLYSFADLMATWTATFSFAFIASAIFGGIRNRKTQKVNIPNKTKYFVWTAWVSSILVFASMFMIALQPIISFIILLARGITTGDDFIGTVLQCVVLVIYVGLAFIPGMVEKKAAQKKSNREKAILSVIKDNALQAKVAVIANTVAPQADKIKGVQQLGFDINSASGIVKLPWNLYQQNNQEKFINACDVEMHEIVYENANKCLQTFVKK